mgnify:CR=1 FL=1
MKSGYFVYQSHSLCMLLRVPLSSLCQVTEQVPKTQMPLFHACTKWSESPFTISTIGYTKRFKKNIYTNRSARSKWRGSGRRFSQGRCSQRAAKGTGRGEQATQGNSIFNQYIQTCQRCCERNRFSNGSCKTCCPLQVER